jgi:hypothetical protein
LTAEVAMIFLVESLGVRSVAFQLPIPWSRIMVFDVDVDVKVATNVRNDCKSLRISNRQRLDPLIYRPLSVVTTTTQCHFNVISNA